MNFVLVHGGWCGGWWMSRLARAIRSRGAEAFAPTLTGLGERAHLASPDVGLETHILDILGLLHYEDLHDVVLVGHSSGGAVVTGVADRARDRIKRLVCKRPLLTVCTSPQTQGVMVSRVVGVVR